MTTWKDATVAALKALGGEADLEAIYPEAKKNYGPDHTVNADAIIRRTIQNHASESEVYLGNEDLFQSVGGLGAGRWRLR